MLIINKKHNNNKFLNNKQYEIHKCKTTYN